MAVTKIHQIKTTLNKAIGYITNPEKTNNGMLVSSYNCQSQFAEVEMQMTREYAREVKGDYRKVGGSEVLAHHLIQSFSPEDKVTPELAHELGRQLIDELTEGKFEYVIATHIDQEHIHNHIIFNSVSFYDLKKFRSQPYRTANKIKEISNRICAEHDLSLSPKKEKLKDSYKSYSNRRNNTSFRSEIRKRLTMCLNESTSWEEFEEKADHLGVNIDRKGKHISYALLSEGQQRRTRGDKLDDLETFTESNISQKLSANQSYINQLKEAIEETFFSSDNLADFSFLLEQEHGITFKLNKQDQFVFHFNDVNDFKWNESLLPDSYQIKNLKDYFRESYEFTNDSSLNSIEERYREKEKSVIVQEDTPIQLQEIQIEKATKEGLLVSIEHDDLNGLVFVPNNYVDVNEETGEYTIWINDKFDYTLTDKQTNEQTSFTVKGEGIIRGLEKMQGIQPQEIKLSSKNILSMSNRGVSISIPELSIKRLFIPSEYVVIDEISKSCSILIGEKWNYYAEPLPENDDNSNKKLPYQKFTGRSLISSLKETPELLDVFLKPKFDQLHYQSRKRYTNQLVEALNTIREEKIVSASQLEQRLNEIVEQKNQAKEKIAEIDGKIKNYNNVAKLLVTYEKYLPIMNEIERATMLQKIKLEQKYKEEVRQFKFAEKKLLASDNLRPDLTKEKIISVAKNQEKQRKRLIEGYKHYENKLNRLIDVQEILQELDRNGLFDLSGYRLINREEKLTDKIEKYEKEVEETQQKNSKDKSKEREI
ncbi:TPA: relaxase/mobilization nuclease domain-containing protein [Enterococcus faecium]|nr:relaxase/mobilization nuclease domain-containing protein [Enterococcus faecium]HBM5600389.1 relaxase/mobilization nuclease domain-containing protein [Enterococcus faecium]HBM5612243.1 relaxase/mobilization nuclease domain-containing protein [Enterococcus faecium]HBM6221230.1 relaxase/mobilization nuclease domain-containing protein [Enterococcus faecium]HBM6279532.1 relaxase/mobilization nuclease domain-containing protein [Enterococcus faecium]